MLFQFLLCVLFSFSIAAVKRHCTDSSSCDDTIDLKCLLLSDTSEQSGVPQHVRILLQHFEAVQLTPAEILFLLVYIVALETGFVGRTEYELLKSSLAALPATCLFHARNIVRVTRVTPQYQANGDRTRFSLKLRSLIDVENASCDYLCALLTGFVTGDFLIVTLTPATSKASKGFSITLSIARYVLSTLKKNKPRYGRFCKLDELSNVLRDRLFLPLRCEQLGWCGCCIYPSLNGLPVELYDHILKYLPKAQLAVLANVNKSLCSIINSSKFMSQVSQTSLGRVTL